MKEIIKGIGVGNLKFGSYTTDVEEELGGPTEREVNEDGGENWHYDDIDMSISFDEDLRLVTIAVSDESYLLEGVALIGKDIEFVEQQVENLNLGESFTEDFNEESEGEINLIGFEESSINLWFEDGLLTEIQFWPLFEDEDTIVWPN